MSFLSSKPGSGGGGVTDLNGLTGAVTLSAGSGIFFDTTGNDIAINAIGSTVPSDTSLAVKVATTAVLPGTPTYDNGTSGVGATLTRSSNGTTGTIDGVIAANLIAGDYILVKNQAAQLQNGVYEVTQQGTASLPYILTRVTEADTTAELDDLVVTAALGSTNKGVPYGQQTNNPTIGVSNIVFTATGIYMRQQTTGTQVAGQIPYYTSTALTQTKGDSLMTRNATTKVSQILRPFTYSTGFSFDVDTAPVAILETSNPFIDGEAVTFYKNTASSVTFTGSGLDDMNLGGGPFTGTYPTTYTITVASSGTPDTFDWTDGTNSGTAVPMSTSPITLSNNIYITFAADTGHTVTDEWSWTYSASSVGTGTLTHQETGAVLTAQFYSGITGDPSNATYVVGTTSGEQSNLSQYLGNSTFTNGDSVTSFSTDYVIRTGTITSVPGADNYIISAASGFDQYVILVANGTKFGGIIASTLIPLNANAQAGFATSDDILGLGVDGSGILFDNTDNSDYGFSGILNENGITGGIRLNQEGIATTLDLSKTGLVFNLNDGSLTSNFSVDFGNISLYATHPANTEMTGITIDAAMEAIEIGNLGSKAKISINNGTYGIISLNTSSSPSDPSIQINAQTDKIKFNQAYTFPLSAGSTGQVLAIDGSGDLQWTTSGAVWNAITGTQSDVNVSGFTNDSGYLNSISGLYISQLTNDSGYITSSSLSGYVPTSRTLTINGTGYNLSADRSWTIPTITLKTGGTNNGSQSILNLAAGTGIGLVDNGTGTVTITNSGLSPITIGTSSTLYSSGLGGTGQGAGYNIFLGVLAGSSATSASYSNFLGSQAGEGATSASYSNFFGEVSGGNASGASYSNFFGYWAGNSATNATGSNFIGRDAGNTAVNASYSNFIGFQAGRLALNPAYSNFFGYRAGYGAGNASNSIFVGQNAGNGDLVNNTGNASDFSILIGKDTSTGGFKNSIAIGGSATNTASNQFMIGSSTRPINTVVVKGTGGIQVPVGTTGERVAVQGMIRYNTTTSKFEGYDGSTWFDFH